VDSVHGSWTSAWRCPWWTDHHGRPWCSTDLGLVAALGHGCLPRGGEKKEGTTGIQLCLVPRRDGVGAMGTKRRRVGGVGTFTGGGAVFYRAKVRPGRPGAFNGRR
jgi:hypothetical protein